MRLASKWAVVTGAGGGIGSATANLFASEGASVTLVDIDSKKGAEVAAAIRDTGSKAQFIQADVTDPSSVERLVENATEFLDGIDVWANIAGDSMTEDLLDIDYDRWDGEIALNLTAHFLCCKAVVPKMIENGGGSIINISSVNAIWAIGEFGYSAAKAGLISLTKNIAVKYGPQGIRANVILPGTIDPERGGAYWDEKAGGKERIVKWYPAGRLGRAEDVAYLALYLASDESSFMTGADLVIDGGLTAGTNLFGNI